MKGLSIKEIKIGDVVFNKDKRIDTQFWTEKIIYNPLLTYERIGNCLENAQYGVSVSMNEDKIGFPIYRMNEIHNMLCDLNVAKYADLEITEFRSFKLNNKDVLFNRTNSYEWVGRTGVFYKNELDPREYVFASYLVRFIPDTSKILPEYLAAFLNTKYGVKDIKRRARQSINQTNVNPEEVKEIKIPLLNMRIQKLVAHNFELAYSMILKSHQKYLEAESILLDALNFKDFVPSDEIVNVKTFRESFLATGRLDAEYYQQKYEDTIDQIKSNQWDLLGNIVDFSKSIEPGSSAYDENDGLPFYRVSDYSKFGLSKPSKNLKWEYVEENLELIQKLKPQKNTILFSKDGSVGTAYLLKENLNGITSGATLHLTIKEGVNIRPEYLTLALNSKLVQLQAERDAGGSIILHWRLDEIEKVIVPIVSIDIQDQITLYIQESFALKSKAERLLEISKFSIELAIEENENSAMTYLDENV